MDWLAHCPVVPVVAKCYMLESTLPYIGTKVGENSRKRLLELLSYVPLPSRSPTTRVELALCRLSHIWTTAHLSPLPMEPVKPTTHSDKASPALTSRCRQKRAFVLVTEDHTRATISHQCRNRQSSTSETHYWCPRGHGHLRQGDNAKSTTKIWDSERITLVIPRRDAPNWT